MRGADSIKFDEWQLLSLQLALFKQKQRIAHLSKPARCLQVYYFGSPRNANVVVEYAVHQIVYRRVFHVDIRRGSHEVWAHDFRHAEPIPVQTVQKI
jgi:hypothetical protein